MAAELIKIVAFGRMDKSSHLLANLTEWPCGPDIVILTLQLSQLRF